MLEHGGYTGTILCYLVLIRWFPCLHEFVCGSSAWSGYLLWQLNGSCDIYNFMSLWTKKCLIDVGLVGVRTGASWPFPFLLLSARLVVSVRGWLSQHLTKQPRHCLLTNLTCKKGIKDVDDPILEVSYPIFSGALSHRGPLSHAWLT